MSSTNHGRDLTSSCAARKLEIERVMADHLKQRARLAAMIERGETDEEDARRRNAAMPGLLGELWDRFMALSTGDRILALRRDEFHGMHWQSLLQCNPFFLPAHERPL